MQKKKSILYTCFCFILFISCGLPYPVVLYPPTVDLATLRVKFSHDTRNNTAEFQGYRIYYKLYRTKNDFTSDKSNINDDDSTSLSPQILTRNNFLPIATLVGNSFASSGELEISNKASAIEYEIKADGDKIVLLENDTELAEIRRNIGDGSDDTESRFKQFSTYERSDDDVQRFFTSGASEAVTDIGFAVIAYGRTNQGTLIYGKPVALPETISKTINEEL